MYALIACPARRLVVIINLAKPRARTIRAELYDSKPTWLVCDSLPHLLPFFLGYKAVLAMRGRLVVCTNILLVSPTAGGTVLQRQIVALLSRSEGGVLHLHSFTLVRVLLGVELELATN